MNKDPEMQGATTQPNQEPQPVAEDSATAGEKVVLGPSDNVVVAEATLETELSDGSVVETTVVPKKKKRTGLIVVIITFIVLLLAGIGAGIWYFVCYNNPEKTAFDAINGLFHEKSLITNASLTGTTKDLGSEGVQLSVSMHTEGEGTSASSELTFSIVPIDANGSALKDKPCQFKLSNVILSDGVFYIRTEDLAKAFDNFIEDSGLATEDTSLIFEMISEILTTIDDEWWQISVPEVIDTIMEDNSSAQPTKEFYTCMVNAANQDIKGEIAQVYSDHRFVKIAKSTEAAPLANNTLYDVTFDYDKMADFINAMPNTAAANSVYNCYNRYLEATGRSDEKISAESAKTATADDLRKEFSADDVTIQMQITNWEHKLTQISVRSKDQASTFTIAFEYNKSVEVKAPEKYRPITDLYEDLATAIMSVISSQMGEGYEFDPETGTIYGTEDPWIYDDPDFPMNDEDDESWNV